MIIRHFLILSTFFVISLSAQPADSVREDEKGESSLPMLVPPRDYVICGPIEGGTEHSPAPITVDEAMQLKVSFQREILPEKSGVQFLTVIISIFNKEGELLDKIIKHAFTFPRSGESDLSVLKQYSRQIVPFGFVSEKKINGVGILTDTIPEWSLLRIEVLPDEEYTKFAERFRYKLEWWYRVKGSRFEEEFFLGIPKVLFDSEKQDTINYGNASAMIRFYLLHEETGERFPVNIGIGTFGVSTPIDVSKNGGGIAVSLLFDVVQSVRTLSGVRLSNKFNAGIELTPFFPLQHRSRLLINARIGYSP